MLATEQLMLAVAVAVLLTHHTAQTQETAVVV
jgi:hypothetical protein